VAIETVGRPFDAAYPAGFAASNRLRMPRAILSAGSSPLAVLPEVTDQAAKVPSRQQPFRWQQQRDPGLVFGDAGAGIGGYDFDLIVGKLATQALDLVGRLSEQSRVTGSVPADAAVLQIRGRIEVR